MTMSMNKIEYEHYCPECQTKLQPTRDHEYWYFVYYGDTVDNERISIEYSSVEEARRAYRNGSIEWSE